VEKGREGALPVEGVEKREPSFPKDCEENKLRELREKTFLPHHSPYLL